MDKYYVNKNNLSNGVHEVHKEGCGRDIARGNKFYIGIYHDSDKAMEKATLLFKYVDGCKDCLPDNNMR